MATPSAHFNLTKPATTDFYDVSVVNANTDIIDEQLYNNQISAAKIMVGATEEDDGESGRVPVPLAGDEEKYLKANGTWDVPSGGTDMTGATSESDGTHGLVPAPSAGDNTKFLRGDGSWQTVSDGGGANTRELTPSEYKDLSESDKKNGTIYFANSSGEEAFDLTMLNLVADSRYATSGSSLVDNIFTVSFTEYDGSWTSQVSVATENVDVTKYDYLKLTNNLTLSDYAQLRIYLSKTAYTRTNSSWCEILSRERPTYYAVDDDISENISINISDYSGEYYIYIFVVTGMTKDGNPMSCNNSLNGSASGTIRELRLANESTDARIYYMDVEYGGGTSDIDFSSLTATQIADLKTALGIS